MSLPVDAVARRRSLLTAALGFALLDTRGKPMPPEVQTVRTWLDTWTGIGHVVTGMARQDYDLELTRYDGRGWGATFYVAGMEHSLTSRTASAWEPAVRSSARFDAALLCCEASTQHVAATVHSISLSARTRMDCEIVIPSAFAVLRLITSSNDELSKRGAGGRLLRHGRAFTPAAGRKSVDADSLSADPRAHRATRVASEVIERTAQRGNRLGSGGSAPLVGRHAPK